MSFSDAGELRSHRIVLEFSYSVPVEQLWLALTRDIDEWWAFAVLPKGRMEVEAKVGGRLFEVSPDGSELLWYSIAAIYPQKSMTLWGYLSPPWCPPSHTNLMLNMTPTEGGLGCAVKLVDVIFGLAGNDIAKNIDEGWTTLFGQHLRAWLERGQVRKR